MVRLMYLCQCKYRGQLFVSGFTFNVFFTFNITAFRYSWCHNKIFFAFGVKISCQTYFCVKCNFVSFLTPSIAFDELIVCWAVGCSIRLLDFDVTITDVTYEFRPFFSNSCYLLK